MNERALLLTSSIRQDIQAIEGIYRALAKRSIPTGTLSEENEEQLIVIAYHLHNLYNAFENIFTNIAAMFENSMDDSARWHAQLLERMHLNVMPLRPQVIAADAYDALDELRRFRPMFRHAYLVQLDPDRLSLVLRKALRLREIYRQQLEQFLDFVTGLD